MMFEDVVGLFMKATLSIGIIKIIGHCVASRLLIITQQLAAKKTYFGHHP